MKMLVIALVLVACASPASEPTMIPQVQAQVLEVAPTAVAGDVRLIGIWHLTSDFYELTFKDDGTIWRQGRGYERLEAAGMYRWIDDRTIEVAEHRGAAYQARVSIDGDRLTLEDPAGGEASVFARGPGSPADAKAEGPLSGFTVH